MGEEDNMTTSDLVARLTARANLTYSYPIEDILLLRGAADELDRLNAENARLREALEKIATIQGGGDCCSVYEGFVYAKRISRAAIAKKEST